MGTFFTTLNQFSEVPEMHFRYAESLLNIFVLRLLTLDEIDVGISESSSETKSIITLTNDESERVLVNLTYCPKENFKIEVIDNSGDYMDSMFNYVLREGSSLEKSIPEGLRNLMEEIAFDGEPRMIRPKTIKK